MFTGIVIATGTVDELRKRGGDARLRVNWPEARTLAPGDSICVSGVCLTALDIDEGGFSADLSAETLARTVLGGLVAGARVNLEPALRAGDRLGGHFVTGHVDATGRVEARGDADGSSAWHIWAPPAVMRYITPKGSITIDGVSLTVNTVDTASFGVTLIPHTLAVTTLGERHEGDAVNLEADLLARYLDRLRSADSE